MSVIEDMVFLYFSESLHASNLLMGATVVVTVLFEIPIFAYSERFLASMSLSQLLTVAVLCYSTRVVVRRGGDCGVLDKCLTRLSSTPHPTTPMPHS